MRTGLVFPSLLVMTGCQFLPTHVPATKPAKVIAENASFNADGSMTFDSIEIQGDENSKDGMDWIWSPDQGWALSSSGSKDLIVLDTTAASRNWYAFGFGALLILTGAGALWASQYSIVKPKVGFIIIACGGAFAVLPFIPEALWIIVVGVACLCVVAVLFFEGKARGWFERETSPQKQLELVKKGDIGEAAAAEYYRTKSKDKAKTFKADLLNGATHETAPAQAPAQT